MYEIFVWHVLQPYTVLMLVLLLAIVALWYKRRELRRKLLLVTVPFLALFLCSMPNVAWLLVDTLEGRYPVLDELPADADVMIVLASWVSTKPREHRPTLDEDSLARCLFAVQRYKKDKACPIILSGGRPSANENDLTCAEVMRDFLLQNGVAAEHLLLEGNSHSTYENAVETAKMLEKHGFRHPVLITDAVDLHRAVLCFRKQGIDVAPAGCHYRSTGTWGFSLILLLPHASAAQNVSRVCHEWLGIAYYKLGGRI